MNSIQKISRDLLSRRDGGSRGQGRKSRNPADWLSRMGEVARKLPPRSGDRDL